MNIALIFAGGVGARMLGGDRPKQFMEVCKKPVVLHTIEHFEKHPQIHAIAVVCHKEWMEYLQSKIDEFGLQKVKWLVSGGSTSLESTRNGLRAVASAVDIDSTVVLIHDGVRPLINGELISKNLETVQKHGNAITVAPASETIALTDDNARISEILVRSKCRLARAPQCFYLRDVLDMHERAAQDNFEDIIDSASLMMHYGVKLNLVEGPIDNIKITTQLDFHSFKSLMEQDQ